MDQILQGYQEHIEEIQQLYNEDEGDYYSRFTPEKLVYQQIEQLQLSIQSVLTDHHNYHERINILRFLAKNSVGDHFLMPYRKVQERRGSRNNEQINNFLWKNYLKINHKISVKLEIESLHPFNKSSQAPQLLSFDKISFHLHHSKQHSQSPLTHYTPKHNLHQPSDILSSNKFIKHCNPIPLELIFQIRNTNYHRSLKSFASNPFVLVGEGLFWGVGVGSFNLEDIVSEEDKIGFNQKSICIILRNCKDQDSFVKGEGQPTFYVLAKLTFQSNPIAPKLEQLMSKKLSSPNKNKNKNRSISPPSKRRSPSPFNKKQLLKTIIKPVSYSQEHEIESDEQYEIKLNTSPKDIRQEIIYTKIDNVQTKEVTFVQRDENFWMKIKFNRKRKDPQSRIGQIGFEVGSKQFIFSIVNNKGFKILPKQPKEGEQNDNLIVTLTPSIFVYPKPLLKCIKNLIKQTITNNMLSILFIKSSFRGFEIVDISHQIGGYKIYYRDLSKNLISQQNLLFAVALRQPNEEQQIHVFQCTIEPRKYTSQTIVKELPLSKENQEVFLNLDMKMLTSQSCIYQINSTDTSKFSILNGTNFKYNQVTNRYLIFQRHTEIDYEEEIDLIFYDQKWRCFYVKMIAFYK